MANTEKYKVELETILAETTAELTTLGIHNPGNSADWEATPEEAIEVTEADENVQADRVEAWDERRATTAALETRYNNIRRALQKIEAGTYGICEISGEPIEEDRLDANPAARTCKAHMEEEAQLPH